MKHLFDPTLGPAMERLEAEGRLDCWEMPISVFRAPRCIQEEVERLTSDGFVHSFHGTRFPFDAFDLSRCEGGAAHFGSVHQAMYKGPHVASVVLHVENPVYLHDWGGWTSREVRALVDFGVDSFVYLNRYESIRPENGTPQRILKPQDADDHEFIREVPSAEPSWAVLDADKIEIVEWSPRESFVSDRPTRAQRDADVARAILASQDRVFRKLGLTVPLLEGFQSASCNPPSSELSEVQLR